MSPLRALVVCFAAPLVICAPAAADARQTYEAKLTKQREGVASGFKQAIDYLPSEGGGKPHAVERIVFALPRRARIDTTAIPPCAATDAEFQIKGADACPLETRLGSGLLTADTGLTLELVPRIIEFGVTFFNAEDELILFAESTNTLGPPLRVASRIEVRRRKLISTVPPIPGAPPPDPFLALDEVSNHLRRARSPGGAYILTPPRCLPRGFWRVRAEFTYRDGTVETERSKTRCR